MIASSRTAPGARMLVILCAGLTGCTSPATQAVTGAEPTRETVVVAGLDLHVDVPDDAEVLELGGATHITIAPLTRHPLSMTIARADDTPDSGLDRRDGALRYRMQSSDAGLGGQAHELFGRIDVAGRRYDVTCREESEYQLTLEWCLTTLRSLRAAPR